MKFVATLVLLFTLSCAQWSKPSASPSSEPGTWTVCLNLPEKHEEEAVNAVELWDKALNRWQRIRPAHVVDDDLSCRVFVHETTAPAPEASPNALAWTSQVGGREVWMKKGRYEHDVTTILLHELGHAFGAQHVPGSLMNPSWSWYNKKCPDATTVAQVAAWNKINLGLMSWCW